MINWSQFPFLRILLPYGAGIVAAMHTGSFSQWMLYALLLLVGAYMMVILVLFRRVSYRYRWMSGIFISMVLFLAGYMLTQKKGFVNQDELDLHGKACYMVVQLAEDPVEKKNSHKMLAGICAIRDSNVWISCNQKMLLYLQKSEKINNLSYGDRLLIFKALQEVENQGNPGEFDYKRHLNNRGIKYQVYVREDQWMKIDSAKGNSLISLSKRTRKYLLSILKTNGISGKELAVASAILLGYDEYLDADQKRQFSGAGAMHVLCVSGLHVGIIAMVLNVLLKFLNRKRQLRILKLILLISMIWVYAAITGFSPSVLRAATMVSFIYTGLSFKRNVSIYNMLAASAFFLLVFNPFMLTMVGFQLSYLAVSGIVMLYRSISHLVIFKNLLISKIWQLSIVSFSATCATFPLSIYYFNQFPNLFLLTNLIAIPVSFLILYSGMFLLVFSGFPQVSCIIAKLLIVLLKILNFSVAYLEGFSFSTSRGIFISKMELILIFGLILFLAMLFLLKKKSSLFTSIALLICLLISFGVRKYLQLNQEMLVVYNIRGHTAIEFIKGRSSIFLCDTALIQNPEKVTYTAGGNRQTLGIRNVKTIPFNMDSLHLPWITKKGAFIRFANATIYLMNEKEVLFDLVHFPNTQIVIVSGQSKGREELLTRSNLYENVILDSSLPPWEIDRWIKAGSTANCPILNVQASGAFVARFD